MNVFANMGWLEKLGVGLAVVIVAAIVYYSTASSSAFFPPPGPSDKVYVSTFGNDRNDGRTARTAFRSLARALDSGAEQLVLVGETYLLPNRREHLQASQGLLFENRKILLTSDQTPWEGGASSGGGGFTRILPSGTYDRFRLYNDGQSPAGFYSQFVRFEGTYYEAQGFIVESIFGI